MISRYPDSVMRNALRLKGDRRWSSIHLLQGPLDTWSRSLIWNPLLSADGVKLFLHGQHQTHSK